MSVQEDEAWLLEHLTRDWSVGEWTDIGSQPARCDDVFAIDPAHRC